MALNQDFRARTAEAIIEGFRIIKNGTGVQSAIKATAATDKLLGTSDELDHATGEQVDLALGPLPKVRCGAAVAAGDPLTSDANAKAITATTTGQRYIGFAETAGVLDQVITYIRSPGVL